MGGTNKMSRQDYFFNHFNSINFAQNREVEKFEQFLSQHNSKNLRFTQILLLLSSVLLFLILLLILFSDIEHYVTDLIWDYL